MAVAMPPLSSLGLGIRTLTEAIQLTSVAPAQAILTTSRNILQVVDVSSDLAALCVSQECADSENLQADRNGSQDRQRLAQMVLDIAVFYSDFMKKLDESERLSEDIKRVSSNLIDRLEMVQDVIRADSKRGWLTRTLGRSATKKALKDCEAELQHISSILDTQIQLTNMRNSEAMAVGSESKQVEQSWEERMFEAHQETIGLIKSKVVKQRHQKLERSSFAHVPPTASPIFFGRSNDVNHLVESLVKPPAYHAILGPGGIGKTSLALNVLHDPRIIAVYGSYRYFLACETIADATGIIAGISDIFDLDERSFLRSFRRYCETVKSRMLFLLDNFETPWERPEARPKVEKLLTQLCDIPNLSVIVTLRGAERPYGVPWTRPFLTVVGPLDLTAARQTFVNIADVREDDADMATLLEEVDCVPLAITLLGAQAQYVSCASLLAQWRSLKTSMVTRGWESRLSSLDVSISLSLASTRFTCNPVALRLLQILSLLPDGATVEEIVSMTPNHFDVHTAVSALFQVALAYTGRQERISVLSPIREYVQSHHPISQSVLASVFCYHSGLSDYAFTSNWTAESAAMEARLIRCISNIHSVLQVCLKIDALSEESIKAAINVSSFRRDNYLGSITLLLEDSLKHARLLHKPLLQAACLAEMGYRMIYNLESHASAEACLEESVNILRKLPESSDQLAFTLMVLTSVLYLQNRYDEGIKCGQESVMLIKESTSPVTSALAYMGLGVHLMGNRNFQQGAKAMDLAASCFEPSRYPILALRYSRCLSWGYTTRNMFSQAIRAADFSLNLNLNMAVDSARMRRHHKAAHLLNSRGYAYMFSGRYEDAIHDFQESIDNSTSHAMESQIGNTLACLGIARLGCADFKAASIAFQVALHSSTYIYLPLNQCMAVLELCQGHVDQALIFCAKAQQDVYKRGMMSPVNSALLPVRSQVHIRRGDVADALSISILSVVVSMDNRGGLARQILVLGDAYFFIEKDLVTAKSCYQAGLELTRYLGIWRNIANALMRLGVVNHLQGDSSLAVRRLNQAIGFYEQTAGVAWAEYCRERLRVIDHGIVEEKVPFFPPMFMCF